ncbi:hypothetical protein SUGI_0429610 [Cryptomeria japonica]|nr:hypothetical protein SUGI_0429610 [Cryptomeria japonica]
MLTPSHVAFIDTQRLIVDAAKNHVVVNNIFGAKQLDLSKEAEHEENGDNGMVVVEPMGIPLFMLVSSTLGDYFIAQGMKALLQHLAENDPNRYKIPPTVKEVVEALSMVQELLANKMSPMAAARGAGRSIILAERTDSLLQNEGQGRQGITVCQRVFPDLRGLNPNGKDYVLSAYLQIVDVVSGWEVRNSVREDQRILLKGIHVHVFMQDEVNALVSKENSIILDVML